MITVVICSIDPRKLAVAKSSLQLRLADAEHEIIVIDDARSLAEGYNRGAAAGHGDRVIFCHDDIEILAPDFLSRLEQHFETADVIGCAGTTRLIDSNWIYAGDPYVHGVVASPAADDWPATRLDLTVWGGFGCRTVEDAQALDGFFIAAKRSVVETLGFDNRNFDGFHLYDVDFSFAAYLAGFKVVVAKDLLIAHRSGGNYGDDYLRYRERFLAKYRGRLQIGSHNTRRTALARGLTRDALLATFSRMSDPPRRD